MTDQRLYARCRASVCALLPSQIRTHASIAFAPSDLAVLITRSMVSPSIDPQTKGHLVIAGLYTGAGIDLIPESLLGPVGLMDDGVVLLEALHRLLNGSDELVIRRLWPGDPMVLKRLSAWVAKARTGIHVYAVRPVVAWLRRVIGTSVAGQRG